MLSCWVCNASLEDYFSKTFSPKEQECFGLQTANYWRCPQCGLVVSKTHLDMSDETWGSLNHRAHASYQGKDTSPEADPGWLERLQAQAGILADLAKWGVLPSQGPWVDFGCGDGRLADQLAQLGRPMQKFDRYMQGAGFLGESELKAQPFQLALSCSVLEHVRERDTLDEIASLVDAEQGVLAFHTLVREEVPADPSWFYLLPIHCAFFSNQAMATLLEQWGFRSSLYHVPSRLWFCFRQERPELPDLLRRCDPAGVAGGAYAYKAGFMDYWRKDGIAAEWVLKKEEKI